MEIEVAVRDRLMRVMGLKTRLDLLHAELRRTEEQFLGAVSELYDARMQRVRALTGTGD